jgi:hypothetical protein
VDAGTSIWLHRQVGAEFDAETLLEVVAQFVREHGLPAMLTFDNDPRFVGSPSGRDFPSARLALPVMPWGRTQRYSPASPRFERVRREISPHAW